SGQQGSEQVAGLDIEQVRATGFIVDAILAFVKTSDEREVAIESDRFAESAGSKWIGRDKLSKLLSCLQIEKVGSACAAQIRSANHGQIAGNSNGLTEIRRACRIGWSQGAKKRAGRGIVDKCRSGTKAFARRARGSDHDGVSLNGN